MRAGRRGKGKRPTVAPVVGENGSASYKLAPEYEEKMQQNIIKATKLMKYKDETVFDYIHHTPNGGVRDEIEGAKFKRMGVKAGYPDLSLDIITKHYSGLRIELKRGELGTTDPKQKIVLNRLNNEGYYAVICNTMEMAVDIIKRYIVGDKLETPII